MEDKPKERFDRTKMSVDYNKYNVSLIGFRWDSSAEWPITKSIAKENGLKLAPFM